MRSPPWRAALAAGLLLALGACSANRAQAPEAPAERALEADVAQAPEGPVAPAATAQEHVGKGLGPQGPPILIGGPATRATPSSLSAPAEPADTRGLLVVVDTPYQVFQGQGSYVHVAAWQLDGTPARRAEVYLGQTPVGVTSDQGVLVFRYPAPGQTHGISGQHVLTVVDAQDRDRQGSVPFSPQVRAPSFASEQVFVYTDRGVYQPGERVQLRSIAWQLKEDYSPLAERELEFVLRGPDEQVVGALWRTTDEFGVASGALALPRSAKEGVYTLEVVYGRARQRARLQVRPFKAPRVQLAHTISRFVTPAQVALDAQVTLTAPATQPLDRLTLSLQVMARGQQVLKLERAARGPGPHALALDRAQLDALRARVTPGQSWEFIVRVRGPQGLDEELRREVRFTDSPYAALLELDKEHYSTDDPVEVVAKLRDLDGVPARRLPVRLQVGSSPALKGVTDEHGTASFSLRMPPRATSLKLYAEGLQAALATSSLRWVERRPMISHIPDPRVRERQTAQVTVRFPADVEPMESIVHMDIVDTSGALVSSVLLPIERTERGPVAQASFRAPSWGSMLLTFFVLGRRRGERASPDHPHHTIGLLVEGQSVVVHPDRQLEVLLDGVPDHVRPGQPLELTARVRDAQGQPVRAAWGVSMVDARVVSLHDPLEITPMDHLYDPTLRTMSTTGAKILSWPVVSRSWGDARHDIALPPFPFREGGELARAQAQGGAAGLHAPGQPGVTSSPKMQTKSGIHVLDEIALEGKIDKASDQSVGEQDEASDDALDPARKRRASRDAAAQAQITIRSPDQWTSLWLPHERGHGQLRVTTRSPEQLAPHEVIVVASDAQGGVGLARKTIEVSSPLQLHAELPATLRVAERVKAPLIVQNLTDQALQATLQIRGEALGVALAEPSALSLPAQAQQVVWVELAPKAPGLLTLEAQLQGGPHQDALRAPVRVLPQGTVRAESWSGQASASAPLMLKLPAAQPGARAHLSVTLPEVAVGQAALGRLRQQLLDDPLSMSADLVCAALILQAAARQGLDSPALRDLRQRVIEASAGLGAAQAQDGSFAYWRQGAPSAMLTGWALEGMIEALELDVPVSQRAITRASAYIASQLAAQGPPLVRVDEIAFWEGDSTRVRQGLTAQLYDILTRVPEPWLDPAARAALVRLEAHLKATLLAPGPAPDALTAAHSLNGLMRRRALTQEQAAQVLKRLLQAQATTLWEPSWFHAFGGQLELHAALLDAMRAVDPKGYQVERRQALRAILQTQGVWGAWHNERGSAAALRALAHAQTPASALAGEVSVWADGQLIKRVVLSAQDPLAGALELAQLDLPQALAASGGQLEVRATTQAALGISVTRQRWSSALTAQASSPPHGKLWAQAPSTLKGQGELRLTYEPARAGAQRQRVARSGLVELDLDGLGRLVEREPALVRYVQDQDHVTLELMATPGKPLTLALPVRATRSGSGQWPTVAAGDELQVSAGRLTIP